MPIRIPVKGVMVQRDGKMKLVPIGKPFEFTAKELEDIKLRAPTALRLPVNEHAPLPPAGNPATPDVKDSVSSAEEQVAQAEEAERQKQFDAAQAQAKKEAEGNKAKGKSGKQNDDL